MRRYFVSFKISVQKSSRVKSLILILLFCIFVYFADPLRILQSKKTISDTPEKNEPTDIQELSVFKETPKEKIFGTHGMIFITAFSTNHWVEAL